MQCFQKPCLKKSCNAVAIHVKRKLKYRIDYSNNARIVIGVQLYGFGCNYNKISVNDLVCRNSLNHMYFIKMRDKL